MTLKLSDLFKLILFYLLVWINVWLLAPTWCENVSYFINRSWLLALITLIYCSVFFSAKTPGMVLRYSESAKKRDWQREMSEIQRVDQCTKSQLPQ